MANVFGAFDTTGSGLKVYRTWLDAISDNVANMNNVARTSDTAFQARFVVAQAREGGGSEVARIELGNAQGIVVHDPDSPLADADGNVRMPDVDMAEQMTSLLMAQRGYQANLNVIKEIRDAYQQALQIGK